MVVIRRLQHGQGLAVLLVLIWHVDFTLSCPQGCTCTITRRNNPDSELPGRRVQCGGSTNPISSWAQIPNPIPPDTIQLDLSDNTFTSLSRAAFAGLNALEKLDLSNNQISELQPGAFQGLPSLQKLLLSNNKLGSINKTHFEGLNKLEKLSLSGNQLKTVPDGTFDVLPSLSRVDFQSSYLVCDCHLQWLVRWQKEHKSAKISSTSCAVPKDLSGTPIKKLKRKDLHCNWPVELPLFELFPSRSQIVFQGDKLPFECRASVPAPDTTIVWIRNGEELVTNRSLGIIVDIQYSPDRSVMINRLVLEDLDVDNSGIWKCEVQTPQGSISKSVNIIVISEDTLYCQAVVTKTNRGVFAWPKTVSGIIVDLPCTTGKAMPYKGKQAPRAFHSCSDSGRWYNLDTTQCQYASEVTRVLEEIAKGGLKAAFGNSSKLAGRADQLKGYINNGKSLTDKMDIIYLASIVEALRDQMAKDVRLSDTILHIVSVCMGADSNILRDAQIQDRACTRMIDVVEQLPQKLLSGNLKTFSHHTDNIALQAYSMDGATFPGLTCASTKPKLQKDEIPRDVYEEDSFICSVQANYTGQELTLDMNWEAFIHIPGSVLQNIDCNTTTCPAGGSFLLQFIVYKNAKLFPVYVENDDDRKRGDFVATSVIASKVVGVNVFNLSEPVVISLANRQPGANRRPVYWEFAAQGGLGQWLSGGCKITQDTGPMTTFHCSHMTNYAVLQSAVSPTILIPPWYIVLFGMHPAIYAGSGLLFICTLSVVITYAAAPGELKMPKKLKHSIANLCVSLMLLCVTFTLGVRITPYVLPCQIVGIALHYFSICTLFWMIINAYNMYRKFTRAERPELPPSDELDGPIPHKPMLRFYLIGWGIAIIVCGITAAVNLTFYADSKPYCFLSWDPSVGAFFVPVGILFFINTIFFLRICCVVRGSAELINPDEPETEEINELEITNQEIESIPPDNMSLTSTTSAMDMEYRPISQLRASVALLFLYLLTWTCAAFAIAKPFKEYIPYYELIFNYAYAFFSGILGVFVCTFYCLGRSDARQVWRKTFCCVKKKPIYVMNANNSHMNHFNGHIMSGQSASSLNSEYTSKSNTTNRSNQVRCAPKKQSNINLVPSQTATQTDPSIISSVQDNLPTFYNPRQNGVARKYWEKKNKRKDVNLLTKDKNLHSNGGINSDINSRLSYHGNSSDANTHLSIEIQIQSHTRGDSPKSLNINPPGYHSFNRSNNNTGFNSLGRSGKSYSPHTVQAYQPLFPITSFDHNQISPTGGGSPILAGVGCDLGKTSLNEGMGNGDIPCVPQQPQGFMTTFAPLVPTATVGIDATSGAADPLPLTTFPMEPLYIKDNKQKTSAIQHNAHNVDTVDSNEVQGEGLLGGHGPRPLSLSSDIQNMEMYKPPDPPLMLMGRRPHSGEMDSIVEGAEGGEGDAQERPHSADSGTGSRKRKKRNSFMDQLEQRIPHNKSPGLNRSNPGSREPTLTKDNQDDKSNTSIERTTTTQDSETTSASIIQNGDESSSHDVPAPKKENRKSADSGKSADSHSSKHHRSKHSRHKAKKAPKNWEEEFKDKPKKTQCYAFVNHSYQEKVINKLLQQNVNGIVDPISRGMNWFPRSVSAYEQVASDSVDKSDDSSSSSSDDDSTDDIWVLQKKKSKKKFKKETSV